MVAVGALLAGVATGVVPAEQAFLGFGNPAVITVTCVLILSGSLQSSGAIAVLSRVAVSPMASPRVAVGGLTARAALPSAFMNNGATAAAMYSIATAAPTKSGSVVRPS